MKVALSWSQQKLARVWPSDLMFTGSKGFEQHSPWVWSGGNHDSIDFLNFGIHERIHHFRSSSVFLFWQSFKKTGSQFRTPRLRKFPILKISQYILMFVHSHTDTVDKVVTPGSRMASKVIFWHCCKFLTFYKGNMLWCAAVMCSAPRLLSLHVLFTTLTAHCPPTCDRFKGHRGIGSWPPDFNSLQGLP